MQGDLHFWCQKKQFKNSVLLWTDVGADVNYKIDRSGEDTVEIEFIS
jgi:hypothetical protein